MLLLCQRQGLVKLGHVSLDGTKVKACASKHKAMSYERMREELKDKVAELLKAAEDADEQEDALGPKLVAGTRPLRAPALCRLEAVRDGRG